MTVYHGTDSISANNILDTGINVKYGNESVDNAAGFYMTPNKTFAMQRAKMAAARVRSFHKGEVVEPAVLEIELDLSDAGSLRIKEFDGCSYEWKEFVFYNRLGWRFLRKWALFSKNHNLDAKYDIVIDETADAGVNDIISDSRYRNDLGDLTSIIMQIERSTRPDWDKQVSLHTARAVRSCVRSIRIVPNEECLN
ncbi:MAG: DUF3990 domain-containing protein [Oscillospiraceae bacterium]|nr:DUF3990 domain-containing protein [Oscillospiraceae bacterium]